MLCLEENNVSEERQNELHHLGGVGQGRLVQRTEVELEETENLLVAIIREIDRRVKGNSEMFEGSEPGGDGMTGVPQEQRGRKRTRVD